MSGDKRRALEDAQRFDVTDGSFVKSKAVSTADFAELVETKGQPSLEKALRFRELTCPHERYDAAEEEEQQGTSYESSSSVAVQIARKPKWKFRPYNIWNFNDYECFGVGIHLYFKLLRKLCILFAILAVVAIPNIVINTSGRVLANRKSSGGTGLEILTLGNVGIRINSTNVHIDSLNIHVTKYSAGLFVTFTDLALAVGLLIFLWVHIREESRDAQESDDRILSVGDYTVSVSKLPQNTPADKLRFQLRDFFEGLGYECYDVAVCTNEGDLLELYQRKGRLYTEIEALNTKINRMQTDSLELKIAKQTELAEIDAEIKKWRETHTVRNVCAFVTLERAEEVPQLIAHFQPSPMRRWFGKCFCCCPERENVFFVSPDDESKHRLKVRNAEEPSNVLFNNLKYTSNGKFWRRTGTIFFTLLIMAISFIAIAVAMYYQQQVPEDKNCPDFTPTRDQALAYPKLSGCYCKSLGSSVWRDKLLCRSWMQVFFRAKLLLFGCSVSIAVVNFLLNVIVTKLVTWERHYTLSEEQASIMWKLFLCLFFNTSIIIALVNLDFKDFYSPLPSLGRFSEFDSDWYVAVGNNIMVTLLVNAINPQIFPIIVDWPLQKFKQWRNRDKIIDTPGSTQHQLNELYAGTPFMLAERYAIILNTFYSCLFYSTGMPLLLFAAFLAFFLTFWFDKVALLRVHSIPPQYNSKLAVMAAALFPFAVFIHLFVGAFMLGGPIWHNRHEGLISLSPISQSWQASLARASFRHRWVHSLFMENSFPLFALACILVLFRILWSLKELSPITCNITYDFLEEKEFRKKLPRLSVVVGSKLHYIASYRISAQPQFMDGFYKPHHNRATRELLEPEGELQSLDESSRDALISKALDSSDMKVSQAGLKAQNVTDILKVPVELGGHSSSGDVYCEECDNLVMAEVRCVECESDLCGPHKQLHAYVKSMRKHRFQQIKRAARRTIDTSNIRPEQFLSDATDQPVPLILPESRRQLGEDLAFWEAMAEQIRSHPDRFAVITCPLSYEVEQRQDDGSSKVEIQKCAAPMRIFLWPDDEVDTVNDYVCLYCKQHFQQ